MMMRRLKWLAAAVIAFAAIAFHVSTPEERRAEWARELRTTVRGWFVPEEQGGAGESSIAAIERRMSDTDGAAQSGADQARSASEGDDDDDEENTPSRLRKVEGLNAIHLSREEQEQTGVAVQTLERTEHLSESLAAGRILDIQPLVDLRANYNAALGDEQVYRAAIAASARAAERMRQLRREDGNVSARQLQEAEAQAASDRARLAAATRRLEDIRNQALLQWGETLVNMALEENSPLFEQLMSHQDVLLLVTLRRGESLPEGMNVIYVGPTGERTRARKAYLVSAAMQTDPVSQGETYFFRTNASNLRVGMRMDAWIPAPGEPREGVEVPGAAVIWYANKLWVYVKSDEELFVRRPLSEYEETRDGWFVSKGLAAGEAVVVSGAQMLFSEEFRSSIPSEDEARE